MISGSKFTSVDFHTIFSLFYIWTINYINQTIHINAVIKFVKIISTVYDRWDGFDILLCQNVQQEIYFVQRIYFAHIAKI
jgi:hypothetical protein